VPSLWSTSPFAPYIDAAVFSCEVRVKKPDPAIYHFACTRLGIPPERCLYVGDGADRELTGAARAGLEAVLLRLPGEGAGMSQQDAWQWSGPAICEIPQILGFVEGLD
jgi:putative hydrolase of the HAD superfamily